MSCSCGGCIDNQVWCVPRGDYRLFIVDVKDESGDVIDITGFSEIEYIIADKQGGTIELTKSLSGGGISITGTGYQFAITITEADSKALSQNLMYHELRMTDSGGEGQTLISGLFRSPFTMLGTD